jgi:hypothetical protein
MQEDVGTQPEVVRVLDGGELLETARLPILELADGRPGALWRGQVFPLGADGSIDIAGPFFTVEDCLPRRRAPAGWSVLTGDGEAVLLLAAGVVERERVLAALRAAGIGILRTAPVLDPDLDADWVVRLDPASLGTPPEARLREILSGIVDDRPPTDDTLRSRLLELQLDRLRRENDALRRELERVRAPVAPPATEPPPATPPATGATSAADA